MNKKSLIREKILITGITGFVGSHLHKKLNDIGATVYGISKSKKGKNIYNIDITNYRAIESIVKNKKISICFHLASEALVETGQTDPYKTFTTNIQGTINILELARKYKFKKIIITSTSHVYGLNKLPYLEKYTPKPTRPYETSKACTDLIAESYAGTFGLPIIIPRFVNIYGPGDLNFTRLIPKTIKSIITNTNPRMWGGGVIRDFIYIDDVINAYILLACYNKYDKLNTTFNFGGSSKITVEELIQKIIYLSKKNLEIDHITDRRESEITSQYVSWNKAKELLNWKPKVSLEQGLTITLDWYNNYFKKTKHI